MPTRWCYCTAREQLPEAGCHRLVCRTGKKVEDEARREWWWKARRVRVVDGAAVTMPDTPENQVSVSAVPPSHDDAYWTLNVHAFSSRLTRPGRHSSFNGGLNQPFVLENRIYFFECLKKVARFNYDTRRSWLAGRMRGKPRRRSTRLMMGQMMNPHDQHADKPSLDDAAQLPVERPLAELFGIEVRYAPDEFAPPVDLEKLRKYVRDELAASETREVCQLIASFRCWHDACTELYRQQLSQSPSG